MRGRLLVPLIAIGCHGCSSPSQSASSTPTGSSVPLVGSAALPSPPPGYAGIDQAVAPSEAPDTTSVLVMRHGKIEYERYFEGATAETLHDTRSATKTITALAVGAALDAKVLPSLSAHAFDYLADVKPANLSPLKQAVTIEDFLTMSAAIDCDDNDDNSSGNEENMYPKDVWLRFTADIPARATYQRDANGRGPWHYCTIGVFMLGQIIQRAAKQPIDQFIADKVLKPLGITKWEFPKSPTGEVMTGGGLRLTSRDLGKLGWMIRTNGGGVISEPFVKAMTTSQLHTTITSDPDYGYLMWGRTFKTPCGTTRAWRMSGNGGNTVAVLPELDAVVVVTRTHYRSKGMHEQTANLIENHVLPEISCGK